MELVPGEDNEGMLEVVEGISFFTTVLEETTVDFFDLDGLDSGTLIISSSLLGVNVNDNGGSVTVEDLSLSFECDLDFVAEDFTRSVGNFSLEILCGLSTTSGSDLFLTIGLITLQHK